MTHSELFLIDHYPGLVGWKDTQHQYIGANTALIKQKNCKNIEQVIGKTDSDLSPEADNENNIFHQQDSSVLKGNAISTVHIDSSEDTVYLMDKSPLKSHDNIIQGLIYYCRPYSQGESYLLLKQLDERLNIKATHYTLSRFDNPLRLSQREIECVFLLIRGKSAKTIANILTLSVRTVESYIENIKTKMNCNNKAEILVKAISHGYQNHIPQRLNQAHILHAL